MTGRRRWLILLAATCMVLLTLHAARNRLLPAVAQWLDVGVAPHKADAVMIFNGNVDVRPFAAAALVRAGWAPRVILSTVDLPSQSKSDKANTYHEIDRRVLRHCGIPEHDIQFLDGRAQTTFDEAVALGQYLDSHPQAQVLVVTDGPHSRRVRWVLSRVLDSRAGRTTTVTAPCDQFQAENWWRCEAGFSYITSEYLKLGFYMLRYGRLGYLLAAGLVIAGWIIYRRCSAHGASEQNAAKPQITPLGEDTASRGNPPPSA